MIEPNSDNPSPLACTAIGVFALSWSALETVVDALVTLAFLHFGGNEIEKECPRAISRKITHVRDVAKKSGKFAPYAERGTALIDEVDELVDNRHNLIHGAVWRVDPGDILHFVRLRHDKEGFHVGELHSTDLHQIREATLRVRALTRKIIELLAEISIAIDPRPEVIEQLSKLKSQNS